MAHIAYMPAANGWPPYPYVEYSMFDLFFNKDQITLLEEKCKVEIKAVRRSRQKAEIREILQELLIEEKVLNRDAYR